MSLLTVSYLVEEAVIYDEFLNVFACSLNVQQFLVHYINEEDVKVWPAAAVVFRSTICIRFLHNTIIHDFPNVLTEFLR